LGKICDELERRREEQRRGRGKRGKNRVRVDEGFI
jgi:hypothetical protein